MAFKMAIINRMALITTCGIGSGIIVLLLYLSLTPYNIYRQLFVMVMIVFVIFIGDNMARYYRKKFGITPPHKGD